VAGRGARVRAAGSSEHGSQEVADSLRHRHDELGIVRSMFEERGVITQLLSVELLTNARPVEGPDVLLPGREPERSPAQFQKAPATSETQ
jgi:hypothetical protein